MLTQIRASLRLGKLRLHILLKFLLDLRDLQLRRDRFLHHGQPLFNIELLEDRLFLRGIDIQIRREEIGELLGILDAQHHCARLLGHIRREFQKLRRRVTQVPESRFPFLGLCWRFGLQQFHLGPQVRMAGDNLSQGKPAEALHDKDDVGVGLPQEF